jgi:NADH:ubiquinone oxidoreductase subunit 6 (subunit J)
MLIAALRVITARNPVHAVLFLVLAFFSAAALWILLRAEFLAIALVLVYVGAVMVLFLFVVMMLDINVDKLRLGFWRNAPWGFGVAALIVLQMWLVLSQPQWQDLTAAGEGIANVDNTRTLGLLTFTEYDLGQLLGFETPAWVASLSGWFWLFAKVFFVVSLFIWFRASFPRYRYDQIMRLGWKIFIPLTLVWLVVIAVWMQTPWNIWSAG